MAKTKPTANGVATDDILTLAEAAAYLKVTEAGLKADVERGHVPARLVGGEWRLSIASIDAWMSGSDGSQGRAKSGVSAQAPETELTPEQFYQRRNQQLVADLRAIHAASGSTETLEEAEAFLKVIYDARKADLI